ncbi:proline-rich protein 11 isoform X3 [Ictalurus punctatus]|uniref:Proline-rich protein 11 isoform X3 n=1 Tax=Ictalurus punctatus TaxID=7998 RepID=A0A2D0SMS3_ICTPU|nr:proline-rich protein 11 isoform X3 [Ictalurus punctatus]
MAGFGRLSRHFQKRRKKNGSSRRLAMKAKQSLTPSCDSQVNVKKNSVDRTKVELVVKTCNKNTERLSFSLRNGRLLNTVWKVMQQCQHRISQIWTGFCSVLFFWRFHAQRVEILHQKVEELQKELQLLRTNALLSPESRCSGCHGTTVAPPIALLPSPPLPPPPPPPPPPPAIQVPQRLPLVSKSRTSHSSLQMSPDGKRAPMVTLADLQKVSLRRVQCSFPSTKRRSPGRSSSKSPMKLRFQLRKIPIDRAPSDTPLCNKENVEKYSHISALINNVLENNCQGAFPGGS